MSMQTINNLEKLLGGPRDGALLRYSLGNEYFKLGQMAEAAAHLRHAVEADPKFSAAWKLLGKALAGTEDKAQALAAYERGIEVATARGDVQAAKEMSVFAKRLRKELASQA